MNDIAREGRSGRMWLVVAVVAVVAVSAGAGTLVAWHRAHGPLRDVGDGGWMQHAPASYDADVGSTWSIVGADWSLCTTNGDPIVIDRVVYHAGVGGSRGIKARVLSVRHRADEDTDSRLGTASGTFETADWPAAGTLHKVAGYLETQDCSDHSGDTYDQLVTQFATGPGGRWLKSMTITYHQGRWHYTETFSVDYATSGTAVDALCKREHDSDDRPNTC